MLRQCGWICTGMHSGSAPIYSNSGRSSTVFHCASLQNHFRGNYYSVFEAVALNMFDTFGYIWSMGSGHDL